ncbi:hypothetical protein HGM15179_015085 [Zosterops borbonicus]|uniref:Bactericidal permeability-increasing protein n=1 Tax=Zosterops borbonicus TaxID=364589 RepID=A0A8K1G5I7_9PASS|nr:hypothetical protein HGM15179_015085 [Zosterops borbonicus]
MLPGTESKGGGDITVSISGLFIAVIFKVSRDSTGHSSMFHRCQLSIYSLDLSFLSGYLENPIHTKLDKNLDLSFLSGYLENPIHTKLDKNDLKPDSLLLTAAKAVLDLCIIQKLFFDSKEVGLEILKQNMEKEGLPDLTGHEKFGPGNVKYNISRIRVTAVELPSASISLLPGMNWNIRTWMLYVQIRLSIKPLGTISDLLLMTVVLDPLIAFFLLSSFLHNFFIKYLKNPFTGAWSLITHKIISVVFVIFCVLSATFTAVMQIDDLAEVDYSSSSLPAGVVFPAGNYIDSPYEAASFTILDQSDSMLYLTSLFAYYTTGSNLVTHLFSLFYFFLPTCSYFNINTEIFGSIISEIMMLKLMSAEIPVISLQQNSFMLEIRGSMEVLAVLQDSTTQSLLTLSIAANTSISLNVFNKKLMGSLCLNRIQFSLAHSNVGSFEVLPLENILSYILETEVIPSANAKLSKGFPLPNLANVTLTRPHITIVQGYMLISADVHYKH